MERIVSCVVLMAYSIYAAKSVPDDYIEGSWSAAIVLIAIVAPFFIVLWGLVEIALGRRQ